MHSCMFCSSSLPYAFSFTLACALVASRKAELKWSMRVFLHSSDVIFLRFGNGEGSVAQKHVTSHCYRLPAAQMRGTKG